MSMFISLAITRLIQLWNVLFHTECNAMAWHCSCIRLRCAPFQCTYVLVRCTLSRENIVYQHQFTHHVQCMAERIESFIPWNKSRNKSSAFYVSPRRHQYAVFIASFFLSVGDVVDATLQSNLWHLSSLFILMQIREQINLHRVLKGHQ